MRLDHLLSKELFWLLFEACGLVVIVYYYLVVEARVPKRCAWPCGGPLWVVGVLMQGIVRGLSVHCWVSGMTLCCFSCDAVFVLALFLGGCVGGVWCV